MEIKERKFKIEYRFARDNGIVYRMESDTVKIKDTNSELDNYKAASIKAMRCLLSMSKELITGRQKLLDYNIIWIK